MLGSHPFKVYFKRNLLQKFSGLFSADKELVLALRFYLDNLAKF